MAQKANGGKEISFSIPGGGSIGDFGKKLDKWETAIENVEKLSPQDSKRKKNEEEFNSADKKLRETLTGYLFYLRSGQSLALQHINSDAREILVARLLVLEKSLNFERGRLDLEFSNSEESEKIYKTIEDVSKHLQEQQRDYALEHGVAAPWTYFIDPGGNDEPAILRIWGPEPDSIILSEVETVEFNEGQAKFDANELKEAFDTADISNENTNEWLTKDEDDKNDSGDNDNNDDDEDNNQEGNKK